MHQQLDNNPWLLNCVNGTLKLKTGKLREHRRTDYITKLCPTPFLPDAPCPTWLRFLEGVFQRKARLIVFIQRLLGLCLTGDVSEHILPIFWGAGANGKTTLLNAVLKTLGDEYAMKARTELLLQSRGERHPTEIADLFGRRLVAASETPQGARLNESLVKDLTGGERLRGRRMRGDFWEFPPTHKIILLTNHRPGVAGTDEGVWRRVRLVPFDVTFWDPDKHPYPAAEGLDPDLRQDKRLGEKLADEAPGILAWMVQGCLDWQRDGLTMPDEVRIATAEYRDAEDLLAQFIAERCVTGANNRCKLSTLYGAFKAWSEAFGERPLGRKTFSQSLVGKFQRTTSNGTWYIGIALRDDGPDVE